jgi:GNAT superfamily N-acetyltransferase
MATISLQELRDDNIDDLIGVCSPLDPESDELKRGVETRREWLTDMLSKHGSIARIAYIEGKPVAQIMFYPERADPSVSGARDYSTYLHCIYNPSKAHQRMGAGQSLMGAVIKQCRAGVGSCRECRLIAADDSNTGEGLSLTEFYRRFGFKERFDEDGQALWGGTTMHLVLSQPVHTRPRLPFVSLQEDEGRAVIFYSPACQFSYVFAVKTARVISEIGPELKADIINRWQQPAEYLKRGARWAVVNGREVLGNPMDEAAFKQELRGILHNTV